MMCQAVCIPNFEILPSFFHFHFAVFVDDHGACSSSSMLLPLENGWAFAGCVQAAWCMKGKKGACKTSNHPFNF